MAGAIVVTGGKRSHRSKSASKSRSRSRSRSKSSTRRGMGQTVDGGAKRRRRGQSKKGRLAAGKKNV